MKCIVRNDILSAHNSYNASIAMDMDITPNPAKPRPVVESVQNSTKPRTAKILQLNAANARDLTKHGTTNVQSN